VNTQARDFCAGKGVDLEAIREATGFGRVKLMGDAGKKHFLALSRQVESLFKAILPDPLANELAPTPSWLRRSGGKSAS